VGISAAVGRSRAITQVSATKLRRYPEGDWFRHVRERFYFRQSPWRNGFCFSSRGRNSNGEMDTTCFATRLRNGLWRWCIPSIMGGRSRSYPSRPLMGDCLGDHGYRPDEMGREKAIVHCLGQEISQSPGDKNNALRREAWHKHGRIRFAIWRELIPYKWKPEIAL